MTWEDLESEIGLCRRCRLFQGRKNAVLGEGPKDSPLLFLGEAPGALEDDLGRPFVGMSGKFLRGLMEEAGLDPGEIFITNAVLCRPPSNRTPGLQEIKACKVWLDRTLELLAPKVIVPVGAVASKVILGTKDKMSALRGSFRKIQLSCGETMVMPIFHPAYLLRNRSRQEGSPVSLTLRDLKSLGPLLQLELKARYKEEQSWRKTL